jgi:hypothetical protein
MDSINISPTPTDEPCSQLGTDLYEKWNRKECRAFKAQCLRVLEKEFKEITCLLKITSHPHDYGTYHDVEAFYDNEEGLKQALWLESNTPENWDEQARMELGDEYFKDMENDYE